MQHVLVSAIEHWSYCPRQCALIHLESVWDENIYTIRGHRAHERVDQVIKRLEKGRIVERALPIWSDKHGLIGKCDVVEFTSTTIKPVEYKVGSPKQKQHAAIQLCAQALCLEEMFDVTIESADLFFAKSQKRIAIPLDQKLRNRTITAIQDIRHMLESQQLPQPANDRRCSQCSLIDACIPSAIVNANLRHLDPYNLQPLKQLP